MYTNSNHPALNTFEGDERDELKEIIVHQTLGLVAIQLIQEKMDKMSMTVNDFEPYGIKPKRVKKIFDFPHMARLGEIATIMYALNLEPVITAKSIK